MDFKWVIPKQKKRKKKNLLEEQAIYKHFENKLHFYFSFLNLLSQN